MAVQPRAVGGLEGGVCGAAAAGAACAQPVALCVNVWWRRVAPLSRGGGGGGGGGGGRASTTRVAGTSMRACMGAGSRMPHAPLAELAVIPPPASRNPSPLPPVSTPCLPLPSPHFLN